MAHKEQQNFIKKVKNDYEKYFKGVSVLDIGSYDINGNQRYFFEDCKIIGIDLEEGPGVDIIASGHTYDGLDGEFDTIISCECFEHNPYWKETILNSLRMLKQGGMLLFTCATTGRAVHGIKDQEEENMQKYKDWKIMPSINKADWDQNYYKNLTEEDIRNSINVDSIFSEYTFEVNIDHKDLYFFGIKK